MTTTEPVGLSGPVIEAKSGTTDSMVILFHGYGSNGDDLIQLAPPLQEMLPNTIFISPNAPERCPATPAGYQWFSLSSMSKEERTAGTIAAAPVLNDFIDLKLAEYGLSEDRLALVGFSQGTMMSLHVGPRREKTLAGILGFSGALTTPQSLVEDIRSKPPVFLVHGEKDDVIPFPAMFEAVGAMEAAGLQVERYLSAGVPHTISREGLQKGGDFLARVLG